MSIYLRTRLMSMTQIALLIVLSLMLSQLSRVGANPAHSSKQDPGKGTETGFQRPGTPTLIDDPGNGSYAGAGNGPFFGYYYDTFPVGYLFPSGYGYWLDHSKAHGFNSTSTDGGATTSGVDTYSKNLGVSYQSGNDQGYADRTMLHYIYIVNVQRMSAGFYKRIFDPGAEPTTDITLNITPSQGQTIPTQTLHLTPSSGSLSIGIPRTSVSISVPSQTTWDYRANQYNMAVHVILNTGSHTKKTQYIEPNTVTSRGEVSMTGQTGYAKAWGEVAWDFYMATSSTSPKQIPWHFPPAKNGQNLIGFYQ